jgi:hypothetical protein
MGVGKKKKVGMEWRMETERRKEKKKKIEEKRNTYIHINVYDSHLFCFPFQKLHLPQPVINSMQ